MFAAPAVGNAGLARYNGPPLAAQFMDAAGWVPDAQLLAGTNGRNRALVQMGEKGRALVSLAGFAGVKLVLIGHLIFLAYQQNPAYADKHLLM